MRTALIRSAHGISTGAFSHRGGASSSITAALAHVWCAVCCSDLCGVLASHGRQSIIADFRVKSTGMGHAVSAFDFGAGHAADPASPDPAAVRESPGHSTASPPTTRPSCGRESTTSPSLIRPGASPTTRACRKTSGKSLTSTWTRDCALRSDYARRMAQVEIDVLVAQAMGLDA
jgi:hypothetical protein